MNALSMIMRYDLTSETVTMLDLDNDKKIGTFIPSNFKSLFPILAVQYQRSHDSYVTDEGPGQYSMIC